MRMKKLTGYSCSAIAEIINRDRPEGRLCTSSGVRKCLKRIKRPAKQPRVYKCLLGPSALALIDGEVDQDREISARELQQLLEKRLNVRVSESVVNKERRKLGWVRSGTKYCQMVRGANKEKRLSFCVELLLKKEEFNDVVFTDESTVRCERFLPKQYRRIGERAIYRPKPKHPLSVHVWAGISKNGTTDIAIFTGIMNSTGYQRILEDYLKPFVANVYPEGHRLWQDNDPKHTSKSTQEWMATNNINHSPSPPER